MNVVHHRASRIVQVGRSIYSDEFLRDLACTREALVAVGPIRCGEFVTADFRRVSDDVRKVAALLDLALGAGQGKDACIRAAIAALRPLTDALEIGEAMTASLGG